ncbi:MULTISPECIES: DUF4347 domain-containing protein [unclassified Achromobacter]|uniref:DUF4347 domain-containing protein n=1 Tax=unclassified Achromobacter TaxID=2626865 RepID=UPI000B518BE1|nr:MULTISPECIES: DUF4347 domain-containing protein [unclassified Achromobacter]OWT80568.1 hypothetical protein CEY05_04030 [Achromobacter sp. HZ34]OWT82451.1 hypothetical protein CEY04_04030 [Achromobacter sp. HZ28]
MNTVQQFLKRLGFSGGAKTGADARSKSGVAPTPLLMALEPRVVYDASVAAMAQPHAAQTHAAGDAHPGAATANDATAPAAPRTIAEHDVGQGGARNGDGGKSDAGLSGRGKGTDGAVNDAKVSETSTNSTVDTQKTLLVADAIATDTTAHSVVFIDPSVSDIQALIAGLPQGTQYVVLNAGTDGFAQMADYLQAHPGADAIHLISHGTDGMIQAGSTWLNASDLAAESAQLTRIGAAMNPGGDFLIYGCDVAESADGQHLVQQIAALTHLNVAASTDATGAAALGGNWTLEYQAGKTHTAVIESAAAQAQYDALLVQTVESYDSSLGFSTTNSTFTLNGVTYATDATGLVTTIYTNGAPGSPQYGDPHGAPFLSSGPTDGTLMFDVGDNSVPLYSVTITMADGNAFTLSRFDLDAATAGTLYLVPDGDMSKAVVIFTTTNPGGDNFTNTVDVSGNVNFANVHSVQILDVESGGGYMSPSLDNLTYQEVVPAVPTVTTSSGSAAWTSGDSGVGTSATPVAVDAGLTLADPNTTTLTGATVRISGNYSSSDILLFTAQNGISAAYTGGVLTLTGSASLADYQQALRSIKFSNLSSFGSLSTATRTITYTVTDSTSATSTAVTRTVTITKAEQSPVLTVSGAPTPTYTVGSSAVSIDSGLTVTDADSTTLTKATITIGTGFHSGDILNFIAQNGISASYSGGVLTLTSSGSTLAQWQAALDSITFSTSAAVSSTRDITYSIDDGTKTSLVVHRSLTVVAGPTVTTDVGSAQFVSGDNATSTPVAVDAGVLLADGNSSTLVSATVSITGNFQINHDELVFAGNPSTMGDISGVYDSGTGILTLTSAGGASLLQWQNALASIKFTNDLVVPSTFTRTVSYQINDGTLTSSVATRTVAVTATDQTPVLGAGGNTVAFVAGDNAASTAVIVNDAISVTDLDGGPLQEAVITITSHYEATDVLAFNNNNTALYGNISATYTNGVMILTSSGNQATLMQWQNALEAVSYKSTAVTPGNASRTVSFVVSDGTKSSTGVTTTVTVTDIDQTPMIHGSNGNATFTQGDNASSTPIVIDGGITLSDLDNSTLTHADVVISTGYDSNGDLLLFTNDSSTMGNITGSYSNGVLALSSLNGTATIAQWQSALRSITYTDTASAPGTTQRIISFSVSDGAKTSTSFQRSVDVVLTEQSPVVTDTGGTVTFTSADNAPSTPVVVDAGVTLTDQDSATMASATVKITGNYQNGEDVLALGSGAFGDIQAHFDASTGTLTLTSAGASTIAQWQAALRSVTYVDTAAVPQTANRSISFSANDGTKDSSGSNKVIVVNATHQTPLLGATDNHLSYLPGQAPTAIDSGITLTDLNVSGSTLVSMTITVQMTSGMQSGDRLGFSLPTSTLTNGMNITYDGTTGTLTITSTGGTIAQWQRVLDNIQFSGAADAPLGTRTLSIVINDGVKASAPINYSVDVISSAPALDTTSTGSVSFVAGDNASSTPVAIDPNLTVADPLGNVVDSAVVAITGNLHSGEDQLWFVNDGLTMGNITGNYNQLTGALTLISSDGSATLAQWQAALRSVTYTDTLVTPNSATRTVSFSLSAGPQFSNVLTRLITVTPGDQTPLLSTSSTGSAPFVAGDNTASTPVAIDTNIVVADLDNPTLNSATVQIGAGFHAGEDVLGFINDGTMGNISATYDAVHGTLTLTSADSSATQLQWQNALRAVTYTDTAITPDNTQRSIQFTISDGTKSSTALTRTVSVTDTDQTPVISTVSSGSASFVAGDNVASTPVAVDNNILLMDLDNTTLDSATVQIGAGFHAGEDVLTFYNDGTMGDITGSYDASTGTLTLTSQNHSATLAQWQAALRSVTYLDTAITPDTTTRSINFSVDDGTKTSAVYTRDLTVAATDQSPLISSSSTGSAAFVAADNAPSTPVAVDAGITLSDADNTTLATATVQIGIGFHAGQDVLGFVNDGSSMGNITATYDAVTGTLTLTSAGHTATLAQWQSALQAVTYTDTAFSPDTATRTIGFSVNDGTKSSAAITRDVTVTAVDQTPVVATGSTGAAAFVAGDNAPSTPVAVDAGLTVSDHDNATLASATVQIGAGFHAGEDVLAFANDGSTMGNIRAVYDAATGTLTLTSDGATATVAQWQAALRAVAYTDTAVTPDTATRTIGFTVSDGTKTSASFTRAVTVAATDQTAIVGSTASGAPTFVFDGVNPPVAVAVDTGITLSDRDSTTLASATVRVGAGFHAGEDVLAFANDGASMGNITAAYDAASGTLTLTSQGATATLAQWQAALRAVTYKDTATLPADTLRTISFTVNDGVKESAAFTRQVAMDITPPVVVPPTPPAADPAPPALISLLPPPAPFSSGNGTSASQGPGASRTQFAPDSMPFFPLDLTSGISNPLIVIDAFADAPPLGMPPMVNAITFSPTDVGDVGSGPGSFGTVGGQPAHGSLSRTSVDAATAIPVPDVGEVLLNAADQAIRVNAGPNQPFSVSLPLPAAAGAGINGATAHVEVRQANGQALPAWVRFDPVHGTLAGKTPPNGAELRIQIIVRDSNGNQTQRDMTIEFGGRPGHADAASVLHTESPIAAIGTAEALAASDNGAGTAARAGIAFAAKPSLTEQFARAHATLHVTRPAAVAIVPAAPAATATAPQA